MRFLFSDPFIKVAGKELDFLLSSPVALRALIGRFPPDLIKMIHHDDSVFALKKMDISANHGKLRYELMGEMVDCLALNLIWEF